MLLLWASHLFLDFTVFDVDGNGKIDKSELKEVMNNLGEQVTDDEIDDMFNAADKHQTGEINFEGKF